MSNESNGETWFDKLMGELDELPRAIFHEPYLKALRAVMELHKPVRIYRTQDFECAVCFDEELIETKHTYPCPTIQAIEKQLT